MRCHGAWWPDTLPALPKSFPRLACHDSLTTAMGTRPPWPSSAVHATRGADAALHDKTAPVDAPAAPASRRRGGGHDSAWQGQRRRRRAGVGAAHSGSAARGKRGGRRRGRHHHNRSRRRGRTRHFHNYWRRGRARHFHNYWRRGRARRHNHHHHRRRGWARRRALLHNENDLRGIIMQRVSKHACTGAQSAGATSHTTSNGTPQGAKRNT